MRSDELKNPAEAVMQTTRRRWVVPPTDLAEQQGGLSGPARSAPPASASTPERVPEEETFPGEESEPP